MITILRVQDNSNYYKIKDLDLWDKKRNAYLYKGEGKIIAHPPCQQWSKLKAFAREDKEERDLAMFCLDIVEKQGGILEHPKGSSFFKYAGIDRKKLIVVWQSWWGFTARKETLLYYKNVTPLATPLRLELISGKVELMSKNARSKMPLEFCQYLVNCIKKEV